MQLRPIVVIIEHMKPSETFRAAEARQRAIETVKSFLLSRGATPEKLASLPNTGFETKKNAGSWVESAMFLGTTDLKLTQQIRTDRASSAWFDTVDAEGNTKNNYFSVWNTAPEFKFMSTEPDMNLTSQVTHMAKPASNVSFDAPQMADIIIANGVRPKNASPEDRYNVSKGIYLNIPSSVQSALGIELKSSTVLLVTKVKRIKA